MSWTVEPSPIGRVVLAPAVPRGAVLFYTTSDFDGVLSGGGSDALVDFLGARFGIAAALNTCRQVHGTSAVRALTSGTGWQECDSCDALWTDQFHTALGIKVADCLPVTLVDSDRPVIANIHAGWRGAAAGVTATTVAALTAGSAFDPRRAAAYLGPSIRVCCFEVGEEVVARFPNGERYVRRTAGWRPHLDLAAATRDVLLNLDFAPDSIHDSGLCTRCQGSMFHSYRRGGASAGRNLAVVAQ